jgi:acetyltransferase-like isoleucine patch superfamily enzyme
MFRNYFKFDENIWNFRFFLDQIIGKLRGILFYVIGRSSRSDGFGRLVVGPHNRSFFDKTSQIILDSAEHLPPPNCPADYNQFCYALGLLNPLRFQNPPNGHSRFRLQSKSRLRLGLHSRVGPGFYFSIGPNSELSIGSWSYIGSDCQVYVRAGISIGNRCMVSHGVTMMDYDGHSIIRGEDPNNNNMNEGKKVDYGASGQITIEDNVWIGANAQIFKGVRIGKNSVVGANSRVSTDVPAGSLVIGNPAKVVNKTISWKHF